jgi:hypothetical protein
MSDIYDKIRRDAAFRREWAEKCGIGFDLHPLVEPKVPKKQPTKAISLAA